MLSFLLSIAPEELRENLADFYLKYHTYLIRYAKTFLWKKDWDAYEQDAEDIVQRTYVKLLKYERIDFTRSDGEVKAYVIATIHSVAIDFIKENDYIESLDAKYNIAATTEEEFFDQINIKEYFNQVKEEISNLDFIYSNTLLLKMKGWDVAEIAEFMGVKEQTVYTRLHRGTALLLERLGQRG